MVSVVSSTPAVNAENVYIDQILSVTFDKAISPPYIDAEFIKLYKVVERSGQADDYQQQQVTFGSIDSGVTVTIKPTLPLSIDSKFQLLIRGDQNLSDGVPDGIRSIDSDTMDGNYVLTFNTGDETSPESEAAPTQDPIIGTGETIASTELLGNLTVLDTDPVEQWDSNVDTLQSLDVIFNKEVKATGTRVVKVTSRSLDPLYMPLVELNAINLATSGDTLGMNFQGYIYPSGTVVHTVRPVDYGGTEYMLPYNHEYEIKIDKGYITDIDLQSRLADDYTIQFMSRLKPTYADPYDIREASRGYIPDSISDYVIWKMIHINSKAIARYVGVDYYSDTPIPAATLALMRQYVICKTVYDLIQSPLIGGVGGNTSKSLGDFSVTYGKGDDNSDNPLKELLDSLKECFDNMKAQLGGGTGRARSAVKSGGDSLYPGRQTRKI